MDGDSKRRAAHYRVGADETARAEHEPDEASEAEAGRDRRLEAQSLWVDQQIRAAMDRGEFDDLPYSGKPLPEHVLQRDPDWWLKQLVEREQVSGVLPPALQLRKDDAALDETLDRLGSELQVREELDSFNRRVIEARRQLLGGPPVVTSLRDVEAEVAAWRERAAERRRLAAERTRAQERQRSTRRRRWLRRR
ncbi:DUF1992 domain-containing protein [Aeromicrobium phragmitis]|uniref:DUF1992 domain-containing protein n=1 Tax=Aeromicrobium phragmitis TaxID=2478914 RepID=A0A3L8PHL3_9ACTN|nr:DUF1992 domain-containing protein [Aeromicrobium phragmitis]RLV54745.1 DUF1992 domain-containing protein [Aeromicrobium phragmitis]